MERLVPLLDLETLSESTALDAVFCVPLVFDLSPVALPDAVLALRMSRGEGASSRWRVFEDLDGADLSERFFDMEVFRSMRFFSFVREA